MRRPPKLQGARERRTAKARPGAPPSSLLYGNSFYRFRNASLPRALALASLRYLGAEYTNTESAGSLSLPKMVRKPLASRTARSASASRTTSR